MQWESGDLVVISGRFQDDRVMWDVVRRHSSSLSSYLLMVTSEKSS